MNDLARQQVELRNGLTLLLYSDDLDDEGGADLLSVGGDDSYSEDEHIWVAAIDWNAIRHQSDRAANVKGKWLKLYPTRHHSARIDAFDEL